MPTLTVLHTRNYLCTQNHQIKHLLAHVPKKKLGACTPQECALCSSPSFEIPPHDSSSLAQRTVNIAELFCSWGLPAVKLWLNVGWNMCYVHTGTHTHTHIDRRASGQSQRVDPQMLWTHTLHTTRGKVAAACHQLNLPGLAKLLRLGQRECPDGRICLAPTTNCPLRLPASLLSKSFDLMVDSTASGFFYSFSWCLFRKKSTFCKVHPAFNLF